MFAFAFDRPAADPRAPDGHGCSPSRLVTGGASTLLYGQRVFAFAFLRPAAIHVRATGRAPGVRVRVSGAGGGYSRRASGRAAGVRPFAFLAGRRLFAFAFWRGSGVRFAFLAGQRVFAFASGAGGCSVRGSGLQGSGCSRSRFWRGRRCSRSRFWRAGSCSRFGVAWSNSIWATPCSWIDVAVAATAVVDRHSPRGGVQPAGRALQLRPRNSQ